MAQSQHVPEQSEGLNEAQKEAVRIQIANATAYFIENQGQTAKEVKYYFKGKDTVYFTDEGIVFRKTDVGAGSPRPSRRAGKPCPYGDDDEASGSYRALAYRLNFIGAKPTSPETRNKQKCKEVAYFKGNDRSKWHPDIPTYQEVVYPGLYGGQEPAAGNDCQENSSPLVGGGLGEEGDSPPEAS